MTQASNRAGSPDVTSVSDDQQTPANNNKTCNCSKANRSTYPLKGNCLVCCLVYRATVTRLDNCNCETYTGVTAGTFKCRWYQDIQYSLDWAVVTRSADYNPATNICRVCLKKIFL